jgi:4-amino-4-deoxy-L-arabinose transferase-like glycosyltransferase
MSRRRAGNRIMMASPKTLKPDLLTLSESKRIVVLIFASLLLLAQTLPLLHTRWVEDESFASAEGGNVANHGEWRMLQFAPPGALATANPRPPVNTLALVASFKLFGTNLYAAKLPYLFAGLAGILLTYLLGCELAGAALGLLAAIFLATDNFYLLAARTARPEELVVAFALATVLLFLYAQRRQSVALALLAGVMAGLGGEVHPNAYAAATSAGLIAFAEFRWSIIRRARPWAFLAGIAIAVIPYVMWATSNPIRKAEFINCYVHGEGFPLSDIPRLEFSRYWDLLGMTSTRLKVLPFPLPLRLHVFLALFAAFFLVWRFWRPMFWKLSGLIFPVLFWWAFIRNQSARYAATAAPYFALLLAAALIAVWRNRPEWRRMALVASTLLLAAQIVSNYGLLYMFRKADYAGVTRGLRAVIPVGAPVYGALTFWMALNDHEYYAWNRAPLNYAVEHGARYLILNDRVLLNGSGYGSDDWADVRNTAAAFVKGHATLVARVPNAFYGDLEIYRVTDRPGGN